jgi:ABC-type multidrug transport system fused ATPase/permease subunit
MTGFRGEIRFDEIAFLSERPDGFAIKWLSLEVKAGEVVALVGPSGAGKSTLASLVPRFYDVTAGAVRVDGRDVREIGLRSLRAHIGIVAQDTFLFNERWRATSPTDGRRSHGSDS